MADVKSVDDEDDRLVMSGELYPQDGVAGCSFEVFEAGEPQPVCVLYHLRIVSPNGVDVLYDRDGLESREVMERLIEYRDW